MSQNFGTLAVLAAMTLVPATALAHPLAYPTTPVSPHALPAATVWYVAIPAGDLVPDSNAEATIAVVDTIFNPLGGFACQDLDGDLICGGPGELAQPFCATATISASTGLWDPTADVFVYQDNTWLNCFVFGIWTFGLVIHT